MDIYRSVISDGHYSDPKREVALSSDTPDHSPFIAPDESFIIFSSFRGGFGRSDLFISFRLDGGGWTRPKNMGGRINSPGNIYWVDAGIIDELRPRQGKP